MILMLTMMKMMMMMMMMMGHRILVSSATDGTEVTSLEVSPDQTEARLSLDTAHAHTAAVSVAVAAVNSAGAGPLSAPATVQLSQHPASNTAPDTVLNLNTGTRVVINESSRSFTVPEEGPFVKSAY